MLKLLQKIGDGCLTLLALVFPMFAPARAGSVEAAHPLGRWAARSVLVSLMLLLLWWVNQSETLNLKALIPFGRIGEFWLPLFAFCLYAILWLGWWLYRVLSLEIEPLGSEFPDIDHAWEQAVAALAKADIALESTPLFLLIGWNSGSEESLFQASGLRTIVKQAPKGVGEPLHVTANRDGIWLTCPGICELSQLDPVNVGDAPEMTLSALVDEAGDANRTMGAAANATLGIEDLLRGGLKEAIERQKKGPGPKKGADHERSQARFKHLCRLIIRDRAGFCPINGVLVCLPITSADPKVDIQEIAVSCRNDLTLALETFRVRCPVLFMICDLEKLDGFSEMLERLPSGQAGKRMGQRFPLVPDLGRAEVPARVQSAMEWVGDTLFPSMVSSLYQVETPGGEDIADVMKANSQLFRFMTAMRNRQDRLSRLVKESIPSLATDPVNIGGFYFAGTGGDSTRQAFASGVLLRMIQDQDHVSWASDYIEEDAAHFRLARFVKTILTLFIALAVILALVLVVVSFFRGPRDGGGDLDEKAAIESRAVEKTRSAFCLERSSSNPAIS